jgi:heptosyltransferase III
MSTAPFSLENKKILLVRNDNIGDAILSTPALQAIKEQYPSCFIGVLCAGYSHEAFADNPYIDKLFVYEKAKHHPRMQKLRHWANQFKTILSIRAEKFDYAVSLRSSFSNSNASLVRWSGAKIKIVRLPPKKSQMIPFEAFIDEDGTGKHEAERTFDCLKHFGIVDNGHKTVVNVKLARNGANEKLALAGFADKPFVVFHISSRLLPNRISATKFKELSALIRNELGLGVVVTAAPKSQEENKAKMLFCESGEAYIQTSSLKELGAIVERSKLFVSLDGGAMHLGAAMGTPMLALFGKTDEAQWHPYCEGYALLKHPTNIAENLETNEIFEALKTLLLESQ